MGRIIGALLGGILRLFGSLFSGIFGWLFGAVGRIVAPVVLVLGLLWAITNPGTFQGLGRLLSGGQMRVTSAPAIISQIRSMSTLVTIAYESNVTTDVKKDPFFSFMPAERIVLKVEGTILAGIDLSQISQADVTVNGGEVTVHVPAAYIVSKDLHSTQLVTEQGVMPGIDPAMLPAAEQKGRDELLKAACTYGILSKAEQSAQTALGDLLGKLGGVQTLNLIQDTPKPGKITGCP
jgi:Protein of unknown function (DUF4230)